MVGEMEAVGKVREMEAMGMVVGRAVVAMGVGVMVAAMMEEMEAVGMVAAGMVATDKVAAAVAGEATATAQEAASAAVRMVNETHAAAETMGARASPGCRRWWQRRGGHSRSAGYMRGERMCTTERRGAGRGESDQPYALAKSRHGDSIVAGRLHCSGRGR